MGYTVGVLLLLACHDPDPDTPTGGDSAPATDSGAGTGATFPRPDPPWTAAEVEAEIARVLAYGLPTPAPIFPAYDQILSHTTPACPDRYNNNIESLPACTTDTGWYFNGVTQYTVYEGGTDLMGDVLVYGPGGEAFSGGGSVGYSSFQYGGELWETLYVRGMWYLAGDAGWPGQQPSANVILARRGGDLILDGGLTLGGSLSFETLIFSDACPIQGVLGVREPGGYWYLLDYGDACTGCAEVRWGDEVIGESCPPLAGIVAAAAMELP